MFVTIVEGAVEAAREGDLRSAWEDKTAVLPAGFIESSLLRAEDGTWRIVTVWESKEAVMAMRASGEPPARPNHARTGRVQAIGLHVDRRGSGQRDLTRHLNDSSGPSLGPWTGSLVSSTTGCSRAS